MVAISFLACIKHSVISMARTKYFVLVRMGIISACTKHEMLDGKKSIHSLGEAAVEESPQMSTQIKSHERVLGCQSPANSFSQSEYHNKYSTWRDQRVEAMLSAQAKQQSERLVDFKQNSRNKSWRILIKNERYPLQSNAANYVHINVDSNYRQRNSTWWPDRKLVES